LGENSFVRLKTLIRAFGRPLRTEKNEAKGPVRQRTLDVHPVITSGKAPLFTTLQPPPDTNIVLFPGGTELQLQSRLLTIQRQMNLREAETGIQGRKPVVL